MNSYIPLLELIAENKVPEIFLKELPNCLVNAISEISFNLLYGEVPLTDSELADLKLRKIQLKRLCSYSETVKHKRGLINTDLVQSIIAPIRKLQLDGEKNTDKR